MTEVIYKANRKEIIITNSTKYTVLLSQPLTKGNCVITMTQYNFYRSFLCHSLVEMDIFCLHFANTCTLPSEVTPHDKHLWTTFYLHQSFIQCTHTEHTPKVVDLSSLTHFPFNFNYHIKTAHLHVAIHNAL